MSDVDKAWAKFRQKKYTSFIITEGVGEDGEPIETIEDTVNDLSKLNNILCVVQLIVLSDLYKNLYLKLLIEILSLVIIRKEGGKSKIYKLQENVLTDRGNKQRTERLPGRCQRLCRLF